MGNYLEFKVYVKWVIKIKLKISVVKVALTVSYSVGHKCLPSCTITGSNTTTLPAIGSSSGFSNRDNSLLRSFSLLLALKTFITLFICWVFFSEYLLINCSCLCKCYYVLLKLLHEKIGDRDQKEKRWDQVNQTSYIVDQTLYV